MLPTKEAILIEQTEKENMSGLELLDAEEGWMRWIDAAMPQLAAIAWDHFLTRGRGAFFIDMGTAKVLEENQNVVEMRAAFVQQENLVTRATDWNLSPEFFGHLLESAYTYDPESEVVFCLRQRDGGLTNGVVGCTPRPPEAFLQRAGKRPSNIHVAIATN